MVSGGAINAKSESTGRNLGRVLEEKEKKLGLRLRQSARRKGRVGQLAAVGTVEAYVFESRIAILTRDCDSHKLESCLRSINTHTEAYVHSFLQ